MTLGDRQMDTQEVGETPLSLLSSDCLCHLLIHTHTHTHIKKQLLVFEWTD